jgi:hypothetical protein
MQEAQRRTDPLPGVGPSQGPLEQGVGRAPASAECRTPHQAVRSWHGQAQSVVQEETVGTPQHATGDRPKGDTCAR